jgi:DNA-binding MarR family transcriptional regulator
MRKHRKGLSVPAFRVLVKVQTGCGVSLSCVAEHLGASMPTTSRIVAKLVGKGFLTRTACADDRRQVALALTPRGRAIVDAAREASLEQMTQEVATLPEADRETICRAIGILSRFVADSRGKAKGTCGAAVDAAPSQLPAAPPAASSTTLKARRRGRAALSA